MTHDEQPAASVQTPYQIAGPLALSRGTIDRAGEKRADADWVAARWASPGASVLVVDSGRLAVEPGGERLRWFRPQQLAASRISTHDDPYLLGVDGDETYFAIVGALAPEPGDASGTAGLRELGPVLDDRDAGLAVNALALANWHAAHTHCPRCGTPTDVTHAGHVRNCPADGSEHFPRTDPAMIVLVTDDQDRALLAHNAASPPHRYSTLAGFVEPGESLEAAVAREVHEEVGVEVKEADVAYAASQPWPFPSSLMVGFYARASSYEIRVDGDEITDARWFSRADLAAGAAAGEVLLPSRVSIARQLVEGWYGGPLTPAREW